MNTVADFWTQIWSDPVRPYTVWGLIQLGAVAVWVVGTWLWDNR